MEILKELLAKAPTTPPGWCSFKEWHVKYNAWLTLMSALSSSLEEQLDHPEEYASVQSEVLEKLLDLCGVVTELNAQVGRHEAGLSQLAMEHDSAHVHSEWARIRDAETSIEALRREFGQLLDRVVVLEKAYGAHANRIARLEKLHQQLFDRIADVSTRADGHVGRMEDIFGRLRKLEDPKGYLSHREGKKKFFVASVMARRNGAYEHRVLYRRAKNRESVKDWFARESERLYPSAGEASWWTSTIVEEVSE